MQRSKPGDTGFKARAQKKTKLLQAIVSSELESRTVEELANPATRESIRQHLQKQFNNVLKTPGSPAPVGKIVISKWIMQ
jgi:flagellar basal body-associated protein FliL